MERDIEKIAQALEWALPTTSRLVDKVVGTDLVLSALLATHPNREQLFKEIDEMAEQLAELRGRAESERLLAQIRLLTNRPEPGESDGTA